MALIGHSLLRLLYRGAHILFSEPIGYGGIHLKHPRIVAHEATDKVHRHPLWKAHFSRIIAEFG